MTRMVQMMREIMSETPFPQPPQMERGQPMPAIPAHREPEGRELPGHRDVLLHLPPATGAFDDAIFHSSVLNTVAAMHGAPFASQFCTVRTVTPTCSANFFCVQCRRRRSFFTVEAFMDLKLDTQYFRVNEKDSGLTPARAAPDSRSPEW